MDRRALMQSILSLPLVNRLVEPPQCDAHAKHRLEWAHQANMDYWAWIKQVDRQRD
jgi:hypothetical protein